MKHTVPNLSKQRRRDQMKGKPPHAVGKTQRGRSPFSCFLRPFMDTKPKMRTRTELKKLGFVQSNDKTEWTCPDGTVLSAERVDALRRRGELPGNRRQKRQRRKVRR